MKMNFKLKALAAAAIMAVSAPSFAAMQGATSGNGELIVNFVTTAGVSKVAGGDDWSAAFDLGVTMNDALSWNGVAGFTRTWNLDSGAMSGTGIVGSVSNSANYGTVWSTLTSNAAAVGTTAANFEFNVIALDNTDKTTVIGGSRYLTTATSVFPSLTMANLKGFDYMDSYVIANNALGTHGSVANGADLATTANAMNSFFRLTGGLGGAAGDTWAAKTTADTTKDLATAQNFWFLTENGTASVKTVFGVDLNANSSIGAGEYGLWTVSAADHTITYTNPGVAAPVPEASTWAMLVAGLGMISMMIRRRTNS